MKLKDYFLTPVLLAQALWVKFKTPKLPEHKKPPNKQTLNQTPEFNLLLLGDSSAAGVGALDFEGSLMGQLIKQMPHPFNHKLWANSGDTTQVAIDQLDQKSAESFDVVITALGVNDVIRGTKLNVWLKQQAQLLAMIKSQHQAELIVVCGLPPMDKFPVLPQPLRRVLGDRATQMDKALEQLSKQYPAVIYFPLHYLTEHSDQQPTEQFSLAQLAASDGFHPGPAAYKLWAEKLSLTITRHFDWH